MVFTWLPVVIGTLGAVCMGYSCGKIGGGGGVIIINSPYKSKKFNLQTCFSLSQKSREVTAPLAPLLPTPMHIDHFTGRKFSLLIL